MTCMPLSMYIVLQLKNKTNTVKQKFFDWPLLSATNPNIEDKIMTKRDNIPALVEAIFSGE